MSLRQLAGHRWEARNSDKTVGLVAKADDASSPQVARRLAKVLARSGSEASNSHGYLRGGMPRTSVRKRNSVPARRCSDNSW